MKHLTVGPIRKFSKTLRLPGDKSISHRAVMIGAISKGKTEIRNFLAAEDCLHTLKACKALGIEAAFKKDRLILSGNGLRGLCRSKGAIYLGNSGTSMRLLSGILSGQPFRTTLKGDASLSRRPMKRIIIPLKKMGARILAKDGNFPPLTIQGGSLCPIQYRLPMPSAQVKSAILLAALFAEGKTTVVEPIPTRDHTERLLRLFGKHVTRDGLQISLEGGGELQGSNVTIPGDISSAAYFVILASALPGSKLVVQHVGVNPTRTAFIQVLQRMGAKIGTVSPSTSLGMARGMVSSSNHKPSPVLETIPTGEPVGEIEVHGSELHGTTVEADEIPSLIDELPILMVAAACAKGVTIFRHASELRVKETDRIHSMVTNLKKMGIAIWNEKDDVIVKGGKPFHGARVESFKDHRTAMALAIAGSLALEGETTVHDIDCIQTSFPDFKKILGLKET